MSYPAVRHFGEMAAGRQFSDEEWKDFLLRHDNQFV
jgi:hypothetical protein